MADKVKSFFRKKKADVKFMNAGKGYKLTESASPAASTASDIKAPIKRAEPTEEAKIAGQAALARFEEKKTKTTKFNTSYAAIQARVKRELEKERKALQEMEKKASTESKEKAKDVVEDRELLAVTGVFFRCPYLSDEILSRNEWKIKIKEFLYEQLEGEEAGLTACLIIQNCNTGKEKIENCVETLGKYLENIIMNPDVEKYRKIRMSNKIFQEKVLPVQGALEFLKAAGFQQTKMLHNDVEEDFLVWSPERGTIENTTILLEALMSAEPIPLELDRNLQVLLPHQAKKKNELPSSFFTITPEELKRELNLRAETVEMCQMLRTKAMREKDEQRELRRYKYSLIRIKFPDNIILQGTFSVHEKFQNVVQFVSENLTDSKRPFMLKILPGQEYGEDCYEKTLLELRLLPATLLVFTTANVAEESADPTTSYLKEELLCYIQTI